MANKSLFQSMRGALLPSATATNAEGARAYSLEPKHALAQYAATSCLSNTFYAGADEQLAAVLSLARELERPDVLNVGGFSDEVFEIMTHFAAGTLGGEHWVGRIDAVGI